MNDFYFSVNLENGSTLCLAPLTNRRIAMSGQEIANPSGYFLFEKQNNNDFSGIEIIAQVFSEEAALKLKNMFRMA